jgi:hypothetical protein
VSPGVSASTIRVLTNHVGYEAEGPKRAVVQGSEGDEVGAFAVKEYDTGLTVFEGKPSFVGPVDRWKSWRFWTIQFDQVRTDGTYYIECTTAKDRVRSFPFRIADDLLESHTISDVVYYFKGQRCDGVNDAADGHIGFKDLKGKTIDAHGGWYDASGDYGKHLSHLSFSTYFNPQQLPLVVWSLLMTHDMLEARQDRNFRQYRRRLLAEAMFGADYLVRIKRPGGSFYRTVSAPGFEKSAEDRVIAPAMRGFMIKRTQQQSGADVPAVGEPTETDETAYEVGYRAGGGVAIAALARASTQGVSGEFSSEEYLAAAEEAFDHLERHNLLYTNDGSENIVDDYCALLAATELYRATGQQRYRDVADTRARNLGSRLVSWENYQDYWRADGGDRPFFHASDAGLPVVSLVTYLEIAEDDERERVLDGIRRSLEFELRVTEEVPNPFGYPRQLVQSLDGRRRSSFFFPHDTETEEWWQGENARLASLATAARLAGRHFDHDPDFAKRLRAYAANNLNWILGLNPYDACMLHGKGRNNPWYLFFGYYEYTNSPGGICNGITAGLDDERGIDFNLPYSVTGKDHDWRWGEQWLPHAAWYLVAVTARGYEQSVQQSVQ